MGSWSRARLKPRVDHPRSSMEGPPGGRPCGLDIPTHTPTDGHDHMPALPAYTSLCVVLYQTSVRAHTAQRHQLLIMGYQVATSTKINNHVGRHAVVCCCWSVVVCARVGPVC